MSDLDEQEHMQNDADDALHDDEEEEAQSETEHSKPRRRHYDEDEDEEDEEDEEEEEEEASGRKPKKRKRKQGASRFIDLEAEVSDEDEGEEDDEDYGGDGFIEHVDGGIDEDVGRAHHARLDSKTFDGEDRTAEEIATDLKHRYGGRNAVRYSGDMNEIPQRLLMPSVHDASLWQVKVKPGRERDIVFTLMRKFIDVEFTARPLQILSAFERDTLPGMIYVEARSSKSVKDAVSGLNGAAQNVKVNLVPIEEMASLLQIRKKELTVTPGSWVRIRRGKYLGDLAQVVDVTENGEDVGLKFIPRIDLNPRDDGSLDALGKKRKKGSTAAGTMRPPQKLFNFEEVVKVYGRQAVAKRNQVYVFQSDTYKDGFIEKDFKLNALLLDDVNPTLDEITQFSRRQDGMGGENPVDLSIIAEASRKAAVSVLQPGDHVEVFEGEQAGVHGTVEEVSGDVVTITAVGVDIEGQKVDIPARSVRKRFKPGDHVKVMTGKNADETGLVVAVADNIVTFLSDMSMQEVSVFSKDLREAAEVGSGTNIVGDYELHDLVQLDLQTVGVIFKTDRDSFRVLDQNGQVRIVQPRQITMRRDSRRAIATDHDGHELRVEDNVKEVDGEGRKGQVLHIHQSFFAFLYNREISENGGVFVTRARSLVSLAPKSSVFPKPGADLSKMNPALALHPGGMAGSSIGRGPRDRMIGTIVQITRGPHKGYVGTIKDTNGPIARVELNTSNRVVTIEKTKLVEKITPGSTSTRSFDRLKAMGPPGEPGKPWGTRAVNPYASGGSTPTWGGGGRTPAWGGGGRTPNPSSDSRTPAWNASSRTPNPYANNAQTPAWNVSSRTPNPYADGGKTPAWNVSSRTPNPYASNNGGATPARNTNTWGGATPGRNAWDASTGWGDSWNAAPTPAAATSPAYAAPTPGPGTYDVATPFSYGTGAMSAQTPASAPTPAAAGWREEDPEGLSEEWLLDTVLSNVLQRIKIRIEGSRNYNYLDGKYEGLTGQVMAATRVGANMEQTAMIAFDNGEQRSILMKFVVPMQPSGLDGENGVMLDGPYKGREARVRSLNEDGMITCHGYFGFAEISQDKFALLTAAPAAPA
ncbi:related to SPT5-transcription elongation protein [Armillaria ostoyae]|uniref:Transcription elongation factor SPT5 n=1 Tax=Armillaria ostoyae TaxID=47428 RepID=A0A284RN10_ARMOS|nr:related to SPT5-transcription elongation protein [Armillaria ostoyae]